MSSYLASLANDVLVPLFISETIEREWTITMTWACLSK